MINKNIYLKRMTLISVIISVYLIILFFINNDINKIKYVLIYVVILQIICLFIYRKNSIIFIFSLFMITYYIPLIEHYFKGARLTATDINFIRNLDEKAMGIYCLFYICFFCIVTLFVNKEGYIELKDKIKQKNNKVLFFIAILGIMLCILFGHKGQLVIGQYGRGNATSTILNEYIIIFFIIAYVYSYNLKLRKFIIFVCGIIYTLINFIYGDRIGVLQIGILIYYLYFDRYFDYKKIVIAFIIVNYSLGIVGNYRTSGELNIFKINNKETTIIDTNQSQVFSSSTAITGLVEDNIVNTRQRVESLIQYGKRIIMKSSNMELSNLSSYCRNYYPTQGGGFLPIYFNFWFGKIGVIISGILIGGIFIMLKKVNRDTMVIFILAIVSLFPRWLVYDPLILIKLPLYSVLCYSIFKFIDNTMKKTL